jgi:PEGA domain
LPEPHDDARDAQLRAAAEALLSWMYVRRQVWSSDPIGVAESIKLREPTIVVRPSPVPPPLPPVFTPDAAEFADELAVFAAAPPPSAPAAAFDVERVFDAEPPVPKPAKPPIRLRIPTEAIRVRTEAARSLAGRLIRIPAEAIRSLGAPLLRWSLRAALVAIVLVAVVGAGRMALPYFDKAKTMVTELTAPDSPKPEPVAAKPTPAPGARRAGVLAARSEPPGARVIVDGRDRGATPLTLNDVALGPHTVVIQSDKGSVRRTVTVAADRTALVSEAIFAGWLNVYAPFEIQIAEGSRAIRLDEKSRVLLPPGSHDLRFENRDLGYQETRTVEVGPGQTTSLSLVPPPSALNVTSDVPAVVLVDGAQVGDTPLSNQPIALGTREVVVKSADGAERRFTRKVTVAPVQINVDFSKP